MVEKILRTEPDVGKIFVLIKGKSQEAVVDIMKIEVAFLNSVFFSFFFLVVFKTRFTLLVV